MKRMISMIIITIFAIVTFSCLAESIDYSGLDYDSLYAIKQAVDLEFYSRPEAEPIKMAEGSYIAGVDIKPGRYYVMMNEPGSYSYARIHVYESRAKYDERPSGYYGEYLSDYYAILGEAPISISFEEGNFILIDNGNTLFSVSEFSPEDYYQYEPPEGTIVPVGSYTVGEDGDIPVATFTVYAGDISGGEIKIYYDIKTFKDEGSWHLGYDKHIEVSATESDSVVLEEGYVVYVEKPVIMKRQAKLVFD